MSRKRSKFEEQDADVDMTPMLDIVFILLIFFIVTTSFVKDEGFLVNKPKKQKQLPDNNKPSIMIHTDGNNAVYFNNKRVDVLRIPARIEHFLAENQTSVAIVRPHEDTNYEVVVEVLDQVRSFPQLSISMGVNKD